ncbi:MAG: class I SAM-dependent rRNA methyltransferase, partial [Paludibacteraceae bacterium]|nr:class I SAM-dependent rRNA methyltransferase [Paludibacteraceae bacterium]
MVIIYLKPHKEENLYRFHPWIFSGAIAQIKGKPEEGEVVRVVDSQGNFLAMGHYQVDSITVRVLSFSEENIDRLFFQNAIRKAYEMRQGIGVAGVENNTTYRLVHGEGDHLPGLVIDVYGDTAVMQAHSVG